MYLTPSIMVDADKLKKSIDKFARSKSTTRKDKLN